MSKSRLIVYDVAIMNIGGYVTVVVGKQIGARDLSIPSPQHMAGVIEKVAECKYSNCVF